MLTPYACDEAIVIGLPDGFAVDKLPPPVAIPREFGSFQLTTEVREGALHVRRSLRIEAAEIPPEDYEPVRTFHAEINRAEQAPVVLKRL